MSSNKLAPMSMNAGLSEVVLVADMAVTDEGDR
jgi:hypothetical protein